MEETDLKDMNFEEFKIKVIQEAKKAGIEKYELFYSNKEDITVETYQKQINSFSVSEGGGACFRCVINGKAGYSATELFNEETAMNLIIDAMDNSSSIESEDPIILKEKGDVYQECQIKPMSAEVTAQKMQELAIDIETRFYEEDSKVADGSQVYVSYQRSKQAICNSEGLDLSSGIQYGFVMGMPIIADGEDQYDGDETIVGDILAVNPKEVAEKAVKDGLSKIGGDSIESRKYACVFDGKVMATLLSTFSSVFFGDAAQKGLSLLNGKIGENIASSVVTLLDDPFYEDSYIQSSFDGEGSATKRKKVIKQGVFNTFLHNLTTAAKDGVETTGNAARSSYASTIAIMPYHFYLQPGEDSLEQLFEHIQEGIYLTELNGMHSGANPITGDFSLAASGFMVENGKKTKYIKNFTISDNFYQILKQIVRVGADLKFLYPHGHSVYGSPSVQIKEISVAGK